MIRKPVPIWEFPIDGGLVLARPQSPVLAILNRTAALIWHLIDEFPDRDALINQFANYNTISKETAERDVADTLDAWAASPLFTGATTEDSALTATVCLPAEPAVSTEQYRLNSKNLCVFFYDDALAAEFAPRLEPMRIDSQSGKGKGTPAGDVLNLHIFRQDGFVYALAKDDVLVRERVLNGARAALLPELVRRTRGAHEWLATLHAGACADGAKCVLLPGPSQAGKTTLVAALMNEGLRVLSDDTAALDRDTLCVIPMPFSLVIRDGGWEALRAHYAVAVFKGQRRPAEGVRFIAPVKTSSDSGVRASVLVFPQFVSGAGLSSRRLDSFEALLHLQESGFWVPHNPGSIRAFLAWVQSLPAYALTYSDLGKAVTHIRSLLASD